MKTFNQLNSKQRKQHLRLLALIRKNRGKFIRGEASFRMVERMHKAGLITACISRPSWRPSKYAFRELEAFLSEQEARAKYPRILPRK